MIKIAAVGSHGGGKTTLIRNLHDICRRSHNKTIVVTEAADDCPYLINENATPKAQEWIFHEHLRRELAAHNTDPDVILCDRSIMDHIVYFKRIVDKKHNLYQSQLEERWDMLYSIAKEWMHSYDYVVRLDLNLDWLQSGNNSNRSKDIAFAKEIDKIFDELISDYVNTTEDELMSILKGDKQ